MFTKHPSIVAATLTPHKVNRVQAFFTHLGIPSGSIVSIAALSEPSHWAHPEEIAREKVRQASKHPDCPQNALVIGTDSTIFLHGSAPLGKPHGTIEDVNDQLNQLVGLGSSGDGEIRTGVAIFSTFSGRGAHTDISYPFTFCPIPAEEIEKYVGADPQRVFTRAGGCDFVGKWKDRVVAIHGIPKDDSQFPWVLRGFINTALGFPFEVVAMTLETLSRFSKGSNPWLRVYTPAPSFSSNR